MLVSPNVSLDYYSKCYETYTFEEVEELLGIELLKSSSFKEEKMFLRRLYKSDDKIAYLELTIPNVFQVDTKDEMDYLKGEGLYANFGIVIQTKYLDSDEPMLELAIDENDELSEYHIKNLDTTASILNWSQGRYLNDKRYVIFEYDGIIYKAEFMALDNSKTLDEDVKKILDSLNY